MSAAEKLKKHNESFDDEHGDDHDDQLVHIEDHHPAGHQDTEGVWLISYADMMTLLMGFFALMLSMSSFDEEKAKAVANSTALYFGGEVQEPFEKAGNAIKQLIKEKGLEEQVQINVKTSGIIITFEGTLFFGSGTYLLRENANLLMAELLKVLEKTAGDKKFLIEGHTDDTPINRGVIASNWELSSLRANAVARLFETYNFKKDQILTIGLGETRPILPNRDSSGLAIAKNQEQNRRVIIKVLNSLPF
jgi:chemotaxis protein MotB